MEFETFIIQPVSSEESSVMTFYSMRVSIVKNFST